jgi:ADP-heptose:LPS heptosyltransferase
MQRILVIKPSSFGDIIHGLQVIQSLRDQRADVHITWVVRELFAPFVKSSQTVDEIIVFERKAGLFGFVRLLRELRSQEWDFVLDLQGLARSGLMTWAAKAPVKIGRSDAREGARFFYTQTTSLPSSMAPVHAIDILLQFLPAMGLEARFGSALSFFEAKEDSNNAPEKPTLLFFPDSRRKEKEWSGFAQLTRDVLCAIPDIRIEWMGSQRFEDPEGVDPIRFCNRMGQTGFPELIRAIRQSRLVVANDSGPMHLAAAMGVPVLALFGPTDSRCYGPYPLSSERNHVMQAPENNLVLLEEKTVIDRILTIWGRSESC